MKRVRIIFGLEAADGGSLKHLLYLVTGLEKELFDITVILSSLRKRNIDYEIKKIEACGVKVIQLPIHRSIRPISDLTNLMKFCLIFKNNQFDVAHAHSSKAGVLLRLAAWFYNVRLILYTPHCFYFQAHEGFLKKVFVLIERIMAKLTTFIIVSGGEKTKALEEKICSVEKLYNINNAINFDKNVIQKSIFQIKAAYGIESKFVVGSIGRLTKQKNWKMFILAANEVIQIKVDVTFIICGEGELRSELEGMTHSLGISNKIKFLGYVDDINPIYKIIDIYVNTSDWEGLPYTFLEAMHHRKPMVITSTGNYDIIRDKISSYIVSKQDYKYFANRICRLLEEHDERRNFAENGNRLVNHYKYSFTRFMDEHKKIYCSVLK